MTKKASSKASITAATAYAERGASDPDLFLLNLTELRSLML